MRHCLRLIGKSLELRIRWYQQSMDTVSTIPGPGPRSEFDPTLPFGIVSLGESQSNAPHGEDFAACAYQVYCVQHILQFPITSMHSLGEMSSHEQSISTCEARANVCIKPTSLNCIAVVGERHSIPICKDTFETERRQRRQYIH